MQLYCKDGVVLAWHDDSQSVPASAYGDGVVVLPYAGSMSELEKAGSAPADGAPDMRRYKAPTVDILAYAAAKRYEAENGGVTVNGARYATDDRAKTMLLGARAAAAADSSFTTSWVAADGSINTLSADAVVALSNAVLAHVAACFAAFASIAADQQAAKPKITTPAKVDAVFAAI